MEPKKDASNTAALQALSKAMQNPPLQYDEQAKPRIQKMPSPADMAEMKREANWFIFTRRIIDGLVRVYPITQTTVMMAEHPLPEGMSEELSRVKERVKQAGWNVIEREQTVPCEKHGSHRRILWDVSAVS